MWIIVMFDLPTKTKYQKKEYRRFRYVLLRRGLIMIQYSIYARHLSCHKSYEIYVDAIEKNLPVNGNVRIFHITNCQYEKMRNFSNKVCQKIEKPLKQHVLF